MAESHYTWKYITRNTICPYPSYEGLWGR